MGEGRLRAVPSGAGVPDRQGDPLGRGAVDLGQVERARGEGLRPVGPGTALRTRVSSLAGCPHQRGLRARVTAPPSVSTDFSRNGPAVALRAVRAPSLKASGDPITRFG